MPHLVYKDIHVATRAQAITPRMRRKAGNATDTDSVKVDSSRGIELNGSEG